MQIATAVEDTGFYCPAIGNGYPADIAEILLGCKNRVHGARLISWQRYPFLFNDDDVPEN